MLNIQQKPALLRKKVAIVHGVLAGGGGGSEARAMWAAEALKRDFRVSVVTTGPVNLVQLNRFYGTTLSSGEVGFRRLPIPRLLAGRKAPSALRGAFASRALKHVAAEYDLLISTYNLCDFGMPAIQCVADFSWDEELRRRFDPPPVGVHGLFHRVHWLRERYLGLCQTIAQTSGRKLFSGEDVIVANSQWTAAKLQERYGIVSGVVYPPVTGKFPNMAHHGRSNDFACVGRISPEKRIERIIKILSGVRSRDYDVRVRIIGPLDNSPYSRKIASLARRYSDWVFLEGLCTGENKTKILTDCRYGIHGREGEAFGIGVAEMVKAGCITFAPAEGGPAEILSHEALLYDDDDDAVEKIATVLKRQPLQEELLRHLGQQAERFSPANFMIGLRSAVEVFLHQSCSSPCISRDEKKPTD
jgi:glycosyltransferase involved in cell wall biosynthesis